MTALVALDAVLVTMALGVDRPVAGAGVPRGRPSPTASAQTPGSALPASDGEVPAPGATPASSAEPGSRVLLDTAADGLALRGTAGRCGGAPSTLERTTDGGHTWHAVDPPAGALLRIEVQTATRAFAVAADGGCTAHVYTTHDAGVSWSQVTSKVGIWHLLASDGTGLHAPDGRVPGPCDGVPVRSLAVATASRVYVLCGDGSVHVTSDDAASWQARADVPGGVDLAFPSGLHGFALQGRVHGCPGASVVATTDGGRSWHRRGCVDVGPRAALDFSDAVHGLVTDGSRVLRSRDGGGTWQETAP